MDKLNDINQNTNKDKLSVFYSYAKEDQEHQQQLQNHLSILKSQGIITEWYDRQITAGQDWKGEIDKHLNEADIILLLISSDFLASEHINDVELKQAMERHSAQKARVIPIMLRSVDWKGSDFEDLQVLPRNEKPVTSWLNRDEAFTNIAKGIREVAEELSNPSITEDYVDGQKVVSVLNAKPYIPKPDADIYFPLRLAKEVKEKVETPEGRHEIFIPDYPGWVEQEEKWRNRLEIKAAAEVLEELLDTIGLHVIVGEPGGGKTTLLRELGRKLQDEVNVLALYVPFRSVKNEKLRTFFNTWKEDIPPFDVIPYLENRFPEDVKVVWLFDGWDELAIDYQETWQNFIEKQKQHTCILTCRTAQYSNEFGKPYFLMGLYPEEQKDFLGELARIWQEGNKPDPNFENVTDDWVNDLHRQLQQSEQLKYLAGSPLLLTLIARTNSPEEGIDLPVKRIDFYRKAFRSLIEQRKKLKKSNLIITKLRKFLAHLSYETNQDGIRAEFELEEFYALAEQFELTEEDTTLLEECSLIKIIDERCQWLHLTFAEWLLAEAWKEQKLSLLDVIKQYWQHPDYDEALALYWSSACSEEHTEAIQYLVRAGVTSSKKESDKSRSALKILVCLYSRSGIKHSEAQFEIIWSKFDGYPHRKIFLAKARNLSEDFIEKLANDEDVYVREKIAAHGSLAESLLEKLASDESSYVRGRIATRDSLPKSLLEKLVSDEDSYVRSSIVKCDSIYESLLEELANDDDPNVRWSLAERDILPQSLLEKLASDKDLDVRSSIAKRDSLPKSLLEKLTRDEDLDLHRPSRHIYPPELLQSTSKSDGYIRFHYENYPDICWELIPS